MVYDLHEHTICACAYDVQYVHTCSRITPVSESSHIAVSSLFSDPWLGYRPTGLHFGYRPIGLIYLPASISGLKIDNAAMGSPIIQMKKETTCNSDTCVIWQSTVNTIYGAPNTAFIELVGLYTPPEPHTPIQNIMMTEVGHKIIWEARFSRTVMMITAYFQFLEKGIILHNSSVL